MRGIRGLLIALLLAGPTRAASATPNPDPAPEWALRQDAAARAALANRPGRLRLARTADAVISSGSVQGLALRGRRVFYLRAHGLSAADLQVRDTPESPARAALPANALGAARLEWWQPSPDGLLLAYGVRTPEGDVELRVRDVDSDLDLPDRISRAAAGLAWIPGRTGFYYVRRTDPRATPPEAGARSRVMRHQIGQSPVHDEPVYESTSAEKRQELQISRDGSWLLLTVWYGPKHSELFIKDLRAQTGTWRALKTGRTAAYRGLFLDRALYLLTDESAPRGRIMAADLRRLDRIHWRQVIPEGNFKISDFALTQDALILSVLERGASRIQLYDLEGRPKGEVPLPGPGRIAALAGDTRHKELLFIWESLARTPALYRYDLRTAVRSRVESGPWDGEEYEQRYVEFGSGPGHTAAMFLLTSRWLKRDRQRPAVVAAAGCRGEDMPPAFSALAAAWIRQGGIWAAILPRESGAAPADLIAAGRWLTGQEYTTPARLAILGEGQGAAPATEAAAGAPDLFRALVLRCPEAEPAPRWDLPPALLLSGPGPGPAAPRARGKNVFLLRWEPRGCVGLPPTNAANEILDIQSFLLWNLDAETPDPAPTAASRPEAK